MAVKTVEQQDIHRVRASLISERTAKANQMRGLVYEYVRAASCSSWQAWGLIAPKLCSSPHRSAIRVPNAPVAPRATSQLVGDG